MSQNNLFSALRAAFPSDLDSTAVETMAADGTPLFYTWRDLERGSAMLANHLRGHRAALQDSHLHTDLRSAKVEQLRQQMERAMAKRIHPHYVHDFFLEAFRRLGGKVNPREKGRYEITYVPPLLMDRNQQIGNGLPVQPRYERICFEKEHVADSPRAELVSPGHPLLQDVNEGWLHKIRTHAPERVLDDGALTDGATKAIYVAAGGEVVDQDATNIDTAEADYANLDALAFDMLDLLDPWHRSDTDLVVIVGWKLVKDKYQNLLQAAGDTATEREAAHRILTLPKQMAGKRAVIVPFFPEDAILITSLDNLSIYWQEETRRRQIKDEPALDQIENYESVNEDYVVEDYGRTAFAQNIVMGKKPA